MNAPLIRCRRRGRVPKGAPRVRRAHYKIRGMRRLTFALLVLGLGRLASGDDSERLLSIDHYVRVKSTVPALAGQDVPIYVRERVHAGTALRGAPAGDRVALFIH